MNLADFLPVDPQPIYNYFKATQEWHIKRIDHAIDHYRNILVNQLTDKLKYQKADLYQLAHDDFVTKCGLMSIYGTDKREKFANVMKKFSNFYNLEQEGNSINGKVSFVTLNFNLKQLIRTKNTEELLIQLYGNVDITDENLVDITPININSLKAFMKGNENFHTQNDKIKEYHEEADSILLIAEMTNGILPQVISESEYGRRYYKGINLQNTSKVVRNAALGDHYQYDLNTAVYAIKLNYVSDITNKKFTYTSEYIEGGGKYKDNIRKQLALYCFDIDQSNKFFENRLKIIKEAITAIGFGATTSSPGFYDKRNNWQQSSLSDIFSYPIKGHDGKRKMIEYTKMVNGVKIKSVDLFLKDTWMSQFIIEQQEMTKLITDMLINEQVVTKELHPFLVDGRNALNRSRVMAYFFQKTERIIMDMSSKFIQDNDIKVLLRVHDCVYTNKKVDMKELHVMLQEQFVTANLSWLGSKIISFQENFNRGFSYNEDDESDIEQAFSKLTGVEHIKPIVKLKHKHVSIPSEGFYDDSCDYGQSEYDPTNDPYIRLMTKEQAKEHYRIVGHGPNKLPDFIQHLV